MPLASLGAVSQARSLFEARAVVRSLAASHSGLAGPQAPESALSPGI
jgi:hypothetical protein